MTEPKNWWDGTLEPKRSFRWEIEYTKSDSLAQVLIPSHYITSVKMPSFSFQKEETDEIGAKKVLINPHPTFTPVEITFIDDQESNVYNWIYWYFYNCGIRLDGSNITAEAGFYQYSGNYSFFKGSNFFGSFKIFTLNPGTSDKYKVVKKPRESTVTPSSSGTSITRRTGASVADAQVSIAGAQGFVATTSNLESINNKVSVAVPDDSQRPTGTEEVVVPTTPQDARLDEIELVKPFITSFRQSDLNYSETGFMTYTIEITYASYKYKKYNSTARETFNSSLAIKYGNIQSTGPGSTRTPRQSGPPKSRGPA